MRAAVVDRGGHGVLLLGRRLVRMPLLFERALRQEVLAPRRDPESEHEEADAHEDALPLGLAADPEEGAVGAESGESEYEDQPDQRLGSARVLRERLQVRIVERRELEALDGTAVAAVRRRACAALRRSGRVAVVVRSLRVMVAHVAVRSPSQYATSIRPPTPIKSAMNPSATGPIPPRPIPPWLSGCWIGPRHVGHDVGDLLVCQGPRSESRHVAGTGAHRLDDLVGGRVVKRRGVVVLGDRVAGAR